MSPLLQSLLTRSAFRKPKSLRSEGKSGARNIHPVEEDMVSEHFKKLNVPKYINIHKSMSAERAGRCERFLRTRRTRKHHSCVQEEHVGALGTTG